MTLILPFLGDAAPDAVSSGFLHIETKDWLTIIAIVISPFVASWLTLVWQDRKEKRDARVRLFTTLMAYRKSYPISREWAGALNLIDVVFADYPQVISRWHELYDLLHANSVGGERRVHKHLELLSEMASSLGYKRLKVTDIDKFYIPEIHGLEVDLNTACQQEWYRVLKNTNNMIVAPVPQPQAVSDSALPATMPPAPSAVVQSQQTLPPKDDQK